MGGASYARPIIKLMVTRAFIGLAFTVPLWAASIDATDNLTRIFTTTMYSYASSTKLIDITTLVDGTSYQSISDAALTATFTTKMVRLSIPTTWATWGSPPQTESSSPPVLWTNGADTLTINLSSPESVFGFEIEPNIPMSVNMQATFITQNGNRLTPQPISVMANGNSGAVLLAVTSDTPFTRIDVTDLPIVDFAIANVRYRSTPIPEPGSILLVGVILAGLSFRRQFRRMDQEH